MTTRPLPLLSLAFVLPSLALVAPAQTVTVTTTADVIDINATTGTLADLPGPDGLVSLSEAMIATNNTPGHQTVGFAIPASQLGWCCSQYNGIAVFHSTVGFYWRANDEVTLDGTTQTAFAGDTNPNGAEVLLYGKTFYLNDDNSTLRGFHGTAVQAGGSNTLLEDNTGGMNLTLFGGGASTIRNNDCGTIKIDRSNDNVVVGNTTMRVRVLGGGSGQPAANNRIGGPTPSERNLITGYGTHNSEGLPAGAAIQLAWADGTLIENNWIGTTPDGLASGNQACTMGVSFESENHGVTLRDNLIAGILGKGTGPHHAGQLFGWAIYFWGSTTDILVEGNTIGLDANGNPSLGSVWGVNVDNFSWYTPVGIQIVDNEIAGHIFNGIRVGPTARMRLSGNSIHDNGSLGIDLIPTGFQSGVSPNDPFDADVGGNGLQNFPVLFGASHLGAQLRVVGVLDSSPNDAFTVEWFASPACDQSGSGEGQVFLGSTAVVANASGQVDLDVLLPASVPAGWFVSATATLEPSGETSEFAACVPLLGEPGTVLCAGDGVASPCPCGNESPLGAGVGCLNSTGSGSALRGLGSTSVVADDLTLLVSDVAPSSFGLVIASPNGKPPSAFGGGLLCIGAGLWRYPGKSTGAGSYHYGPGLVSLVQAVLPPSAWLQPGSTWRFQAWHRDLGGSCGSDFNLSNALELVFLP